MEKITKKSFIEILCNGKSKFIYSFFRKNDVIIKALLHEITTEKIKEIKERTVTEHGAEFLTFSNGSRLYFNQDGKKEYFKHIENGITFIIQKTAVFDSFDDMEYQNYIVYAV